MRKLLVIALALVLSVSQARDAEFSDWIASQFVTEFLERVECAQEPVAIELGVAGTWEEGRYYCFVFKERQELIGATQLLDEICDVIWESAGEVAATRYRSRSNWGWFHSSEREWVEVLIGFAWEPYERGTYFTVEYEVFKDDRSPRELVTLRVALPYEGQKTTYGD